MKNHRFSIAAILFAASLASAASAQDLPNAPTPAQASSQPNTQPTDRNSPSPVAWRYAKYIRADQRALPLHASDKVVLGFHDAFSPTSMLVWTLAAGYEQIVNGAPNYGTSNIAFAQRVGAAFVRDSSEGLFTDSIFAPVFHQDPRYYKLGPSRRGLHRALYAITRPLITRTDGGHAAPNLSLLSGDFFGSWFTDAYYPRINRGFDENAKTFGGSIGSNALGDLLQEFEDDLIEFGHKKHS